jgi:hypothetical protein
MDESVVLEIGRGGPESYREMASVICGIQCLEAIYRIVAVFSKRDLALVQPPQVRSCKLLSI